MHLVKIRQNHSIKDLTQSKVIGDIKLPHFFVFSSKVTLRLSEHKRHNCTFCALAHAKSHYFANSMTFS